MTALLLAALLALVLHVRLMAEHAEALRRIEAARARSRMALVGARMASTGVGLAALGIAAVAAARQMEETFAAIRREIDGGRA